MHPRVLLIEDEPNIAEALRFLLGRDGWAVDVHAQGDTALEAVERRAPDAVVLDVMLPGRSGYEVLADLRADPRWATLPVVVLTARGHAEDRARAEAAGATRFMAKPFSNTEVVEVLRAFKPERPGD